MLRTSRTRSAAVMKAAISVVWYENPHHWEIFSDTRLTLGAMPLTPLPSRAAAMLPPIQDPWPYQSVSAGPPNWAARSSSDTPNRVSQSGGASGGGGATSRAALG